MTALFLIVDQYRAAALALADLDLPPEVVADTLESLSGELEVKAQSVAFMARSIEAEAEAMKDWARKANDRAGAALARAESLREYIARCMQATGVLKIEGPGIRLGFRRSSAVVIDDAGMIPAEFMRHLPAPPPAPDKKAIADAFKAGRDVTGVHIESRQSLQIT